MIEPCPICSDGGGFHYDDCGSGVRVPEHLLLQKVEPVRVRLTDEEIAQRRAEAAARRRTI